jgi:hypothetical protein
VGILSASSWTQDPVGCHKVDGQFHARDWIGILLNPAFAHRFPHMLLAVLISAAWFVVTAQAIRELPDRISGRAVGVGGPCVVREGDPAAGHFPRKVSSAALTSSAWVHSRPCGAPSIST